MFHPILLYSGTTIVAAGIVGLVYFLRIKLDHRIAKEEASFLRHFAFGFLFFGLVHVPVFFINLDLIVISATVLQITYSLAFLIMLIANLLFLRGLFILQGKSNFWKNKVLAILFVVLIMITLVPFLTFGNRAVPFLITFNLLIFQAPLHLYFAFSFIKLRGQLPAYHTGFMIFAIAWIFVIVLDVIIWRLIFNFPTDFWVIKLISLKKWYVARAVAHLLMLAGVWKCCRVPFRLPDKN